MMSATRNHLSWISPTLVALSMLPTVRADCFVDFEGFEHCSLSHGARIGIAIAIIVLGLLGLAAAFAYRRRRMQRFGVNNANYAGAQNSNYPPNVYPSSPYNGQQGYYSNAPQYPPQTYNNGYNPQAGFAPPQGAPPGYYPPPQGPPPATGKEMSV